MIDCAGARLDLFALKFRQSRAPARGRCVKSGFSIAPSIDSASASTIYMSLCFVTLWLGCAEDA